MCCVLSAKLYIVVSVMFSRSVSNFIVLRANVEDGSSTDTVPLASTVAHVVVGAGSVLRCSPPYPVDEYISRYALHLDTRWVAMIEVG